jgi:hypothetical protein
MERNPESSGAKKGGLWFPVFEKVVILAALGLASWAMTQARNKGRELPGGTTPPPPAP